MTLELALDAGWLFGIIAAGLVWERWYDRRAAKQELQRLRDRHQQTTA